jgi:hypothetical protein
MVIRIYQSNDKEPNWSFVVQDAVAGRYLSTA